MLATLVCFSDGDGIISFMKHARKAVSSEQMDMRLEGKTIIFILTYVFAGQPLYRSIGVWI